MAWLIAIIVLFLVGGWLVMRSPPPAPLGPPPPDEAEVRALRDELLRRLQERLPGWTYEVPPDEPALLLGKDTATERQMRLELAQLAARWKHTRDQEGAEKAEELLEAFVEGVSGQQEGSASESADLEAFTSALALSLVRPDAVAPGALSRPAGALDAMLVLRNPERPEPLREEDLAPHGLTAEEAFEKALANTESDAAEGLPVEVLSGTEDEPEALRIAPDDPLAAGYALAPALAKRLSEKHAGRTLRLWPARPDYLVAFFGDATPDSLDVDIRAPQSEPLAPEALSRLHM